MLGMSDYSINMITSTKIKYLGIFLLTLSIATKNTGSILNLHENGHAFITFFAAGLIIVSLHNQYNNYNNNAKKSLHDVNISMYSGGLALLALSLATQSNFNLINTLLAFTAAITLIFAKYGNQEKYTNLLKFIGFGSIILSNSLM